MEFSGQLAQGVPALSGDRVRKGRGSVRREALEGDDGIAARHREGDVAVAVFQVVVRLMLSWEIHRHKGSHELDIQQNECRADLS